jgi:hypothetical protein
MISNAKYPETKILSSREDISAHIHHFDFDTHSDEEAKMDIAHATHPAAVVSSKSPM